MAHRNPQSIGARLDGRVAWLVLLAAWVVVTAGGGQIQAAPEPAQGADTAAAASHQTVMDRYCLGCHTEAARQRGTVPVALEGLELAQVGQDAEVWELVVRKMRAGLMPPSGMPRPDPDAADAFADFVEAGLDRAAAARPDPGRTEPFHRLNRAEYRNAARDLIALDVDVSALLPADDSSYGFDNIAGVLKVSPTLMERYLTAAQKISRLAVGTPLPQPNVDYFRVADDLSQDVHLPGLPLGTRGGTRITYTFPMDGEYEFRPRLTRDLNEGVPLYTEDQTLEISVDGERVGLFTLPGVTGRGRGGGRGARPGPQEPSEPDDSAPAPESDAPDAGAASVQEPAPDGGQSEPQSQRPAEPPISQIEQRIRAGAAERQARNTADESWNLRVPVRAGQREVVVTFLNRTPELAETARLPFHRPYPAGVNIPETRQGVYLRSVEIAGPFDPSGPGSGQSRERIFRCEPPAGATAAEAEACAGTILSTLARRAYRRPVAGDDVEPLLAFYRDGYASGGFDAGIEHALRRLLVSPEFLFRVERDPEGVRPGEAYPVDPIALASRLSFFLWSSVPDDELLRLAEQGALADPAVLGRQVRRMLADPRSDAFVENFAGQWLFLRNLEAVVPVQSIFPDFDDGLRQAFRTETELFFESLIREDRSAYDLLRADYTFVNERLAVHYGFPAITGSHFRRVTLPPDSPRRGLLGHGSVLTVTSHPNRTSPVVRGKWILENLLGTPPPAPPPDVPPLEAVDTPGAVLSMRERMALHRANPVCASCHAMMDPLGLALENFDATGKWRTLDDASLPIDASSRFPDGTPFEGPDGLREGLLASDRFVATMTEKMLTYALGRGVEYYDMPAVRAIMREAAADEYRFSSLITAIVRSAPFTMRRAPDAGRAAAARNSEPRTPVAWSPEPGA